MESESDVSPEAAETTSARPSRRQLLALAGGAVVVAGGGFVAFSALFGPGNNGGRGGRTNYQLPDVVLNARREVREAYEFALQRPEVLEAMPCFCGCAYDGHQHNRDCFVQGFAPDGSVTLDPHGLT